MKNEKIMFWDDERNIGNSLIVTLAYGWKFAAYDDEHVRGFDTIREAKQAVREAKPCECVDCKGRA
jgi:hypothetical protein